MAGAPGGMIKVKFGSGQVRRYSLRVHQRDSYPAIAQNAVQLTRQYADIRGLALTLMLLRRAKRIRFRDSFRIMASSTRCGLHAPDRFSSLRDYRAWSDARRPIPYR